MPVVGVITPGGARGRAGDAQPPDRAARDAGTVEAGRYAELVHALDAGVELFPVACPRLVPLIESDDPFSAETTEAVREYAPPLKDAGVDTVILGCTHYPLIRPIFQRVFGRDVTLVFSAEETAREVAETLARKGIENDPDREGEYRFLTTGDPGAFRAMGGRFLQLPLAEVEHVTPADLARRPRSARDGGPPPRRAPRPLEMIPDFLEQPHGSALSPREDAGAVHGLARGGRSALALRPGPRLADRGVLAASGLHRRAHPREAARASSTGARSRSSG